MPIQVDFEEDALNMTPMIDVVFNLLVFFLVGSTFMADEREMSLQLPQVSNAAPLTEAPDAMVVNVLANGTLSVDNQPLTLERLEQRLTEARANYPKQAVVVRGHASVEYQSVAAVIAVCKRANIARLDVRVMEK